MVPHQDPAPESGWTPILKKYAEVAELAKAVAHHILKKHVRVKTAYRASHCSMPATPALLVLSTAQSPDLMTLSIIS